MANWMKRIKLSWQMMIRGKVKTDVYDALLKTKDGVFRCDAAHALDVAYMVSCLEPLSQYPGGISGGVNKYELGELMLEYLDGSKDCEEVRADAIEWLQDLKDEKEDMNALARARQRGHQERFELEQVEDDPEYFHVVDRGLEKEDYDVVDVGPYGRMMDLCDSLNSGETSRRDHT